MLNILLLVVHCVKYSKIDHRSNHRNAYVYWHWDHNILTQISITLIGHPAVLYHKRIHLISSPVYSTSIKHPVYWFSVFNPVMEIKKGIRHDCLLKGTWCMFDCPLPNCHWLHYYLAILSIATDYHTFWRELNPWEIAFIDLAIFFMVACTSLYYI